MGFRSLVGTWHYSGGTAGTVTLPVGAFVIQIAFGGGTCQIFGGDTVGAPGDSVVLQFRHDAVRSTPGKTDIVFTGTSEYFVEWVTNP